MHNCIINKFYICISFSFINYKYIAFNDKVRSTAVPKLYRYYVHNLYSAIYMRDLICKRKMWSGSGK